MTITTVPYHSHQNRTPAETSAMYIKSSFSDQGKVPECNAYEALWNRHEQAGWSEDLILHIDGVSGKKRTYQEFRIRAVLAATTLGSPVSGLQSGIGEMIAIVSQNSLDCAVLVHSLLLLATPFVFFNPYWTHFEFEYALKLIKPTRLFVQDQLFSTFVPIAKNMSKEHIYILGQKIEGLGTFEEMVEEARTRAMTPISPRAATRDTLAYLVFSSGTTGLPKAVMMSHGNIISNLNKSEFRSGFGPDSIGHAQQHKIPIHLVQALMSFSSGLSSYCFYPFIAPATFVIITSPSLETTLELIARYRVTVLRLRPAFIRQLLNYPRLKDADLSSLQLVLTSGSYFPAELLAKLAIAMPHRFYLGQTYGMTESIAITVLQALSIIPGETDFHVVDSVGTLFPGVEARILREDGSEADVNEAGELYVRSECVSVGYWNDEKATREAFIDGWIRTGDLVRVNQNGLFFIVGRIKDIFKTPAGRQVSPSQVEDVLLSEPQGLIADVIVAGVRPSLSSESVDDKGLLIPRGWIVLSDKGKEFGANVVVKELENWYKERLSNHKWLHGGIEIVDEIPKSSAGKPLREVLQKKYEQASSENT